MSETNNLSRRRFLQATGGAAGAAALAGCTGGDGTPTATETDGDTGGDSPTATDTPSEINKGGQLELINATTTTFDPVKNTDTAGGRVIQNVFDMLMNYKNGQAAVEKQLADSFETNDDFTRFTFTLKDATFHNGNPVRAQDFVYSWERLAGSENSRRAPFILGFLGVAHETDDEGNYVPGSLGVEAADDSTFVVNQDEPFASSLELIAYTSFAAVPEGIVGDIEGYDGEMSHKEFATENPIGAGPFEFDNWAQGEDMRITRYDDYHEEPAYLDAVHWKVIEDDNAQFQYIQNKNADAFGIPTPRYDSSKANVERTDEKGRGRGTYGPLQNGETVNYARVPELSTGYFAFNAAAVPAPVRKAFAYVANQKEFAEQVFKNRAAPAYHFTPPLIYPGGGNAYTEHAKNNYPYGYNEALIGEAKRVMEEAGYGPDNTFDLTLTIYSSEAFQQMSEIMRDRLSAAHVNMKIEQAEFSTLLNRGRKGNLEAYSLGWIADYPAPDNFLQFFNPPQTDTSLESPVSYTDWDDVDSEAKQKATEAWKKVQDNPQPSESAQAQRNEAYIALEEANWSDAVIINLFHGISEPMWYDWAHIPLAGAMGGSRRMHLRSWKEPDAPTN